MMFSVHAPRSPQVQLKRSKSMLQKFVPRGGIIKTLYTTLRTRSIEFPPIDHDIQWTIGVMNCGRPPEQIRAVCEQQLDSYMLIYLLVFSTLVPSVLTVGARAVGGAKALNGGEGSGRGGGSDENGIRECRHLWAGGWAREDWNVGMCSIARVEGRLGSLDIPSRTGAVPIEMIGNFCGFTSYHLLTCIGLRKYV